MTKTKTLSAVLAVIISLLMVATALVPATADAASVPSKVKTVKVTKKIPTAAKIKWSKAKGAKKYQIAYKEKGAKDFKTKYVNGTSKVLSGLVSAHKYYFKVRGVNAAGNGAFSKTKAFTTPKKYYSVKFKQPKHGELAYLETSSGRAYYKSKKFLAGTKLTLRAYGDIEEYYDDEENEINQITRITKIYRNGKVMPEKLFKIKDYAVYKNYSYRFTVKSNVSFGFKSESKRATAKDIEKYNKKVNEYSDNEQEKNVEATFTVEGVTFRYMKYSEYNDNGKPADPHVIGIWCDIIDDDANPLRYALGDEINTVVLKSNIYQRVFDETLGKWADGFIYDNHTYTFKEFSYE